LALLEACRVEYRHYRRHRQYTAGFGGDPGRAVQIPRVCYAHAGKWHLGAEKQSLPVNQGFDEHHVGVLETTDGTLYPESMRRSGMLESAIAAKQPNKVLPWHVRLLFRAGFLR
jgi:hypothetical protein